MTQPLTVRTPGPPSPTPDPTTGLAVPGAPIVEPVLGYLSQGAVATQSASIELNAAGHTVVTAYTCLVPPGTTITSDSVIVDVDGVEYQVEGKPAKRRSRGRVVFIAATVLSISDLKGAR